MRKLRVLSVWGTKVLDGDMNPLIGAPRLERLEALDPHLEHYSHTEEELDAILAARHPKRAPSPGDQEGFLVQASLDDLADRH